jgi:hypothetical protein
MDRQTQNRCKKRTKRMNESINYKCTCNPNAIIFSSIPRKGKQTKKSIILFLNISHLGFLDNIIIPIHTHIPRSSSSNRKPAIKSTTVYANSKSIQKSSQKTKNQNKYEVLIIIITTIPYTACRRRRYTFDDDDDS